MYESHRPSTCPDHWDGVAGIGVRRVSAPATNGATLPSISATPQELAKSGHNPFQDFLKVPLQSRTGFSIGPHHNAGDSLNLQPLLPLFSGPAMGFVRTAELVAILSAESARTVRFSDLQSSFFLSPHNANEWVWGTRPILQFPTATSSRLGTGRWCAGPTAALIYENGPWFGGVLTYELMSFAGNRARGSVNQTYVEPEVSYNLESGWYGTIDPPMTFDWTAKRSNGWTILIGADVGKAFSLGSNAMGLQVGAYDLLKRPDDAPGWTIRVQLTALFPTVH
jgi:hypothetical protein